LSSSDKDTSIRFPLRQSSTSARSPLTPSTR
jgi:hypothetical protein